MSRKGEAIRIRVLPAMRAELERIARGRLTSVSEIAREALLQYLAARGISAEALHKPPVKLASTVSTLADATEADALSKLAPGAAIGARAVRARAPKRRPRRR